MRKALELLGELHETDIEWMAGHGETKFARAGSVLVEQGVPIDFIYVVLEGQLKVAFSRHANETIATLFSGDIVGEMSFISSRPPSTSVIAVRDSHILEIPRSIVQQRLDTDLEFAARFYKALAGFLASRLQGTVERLGYGHGAEGLAVDELDDLALDCVSQAADRFDTLLKRVRAN
jgi:CRP-like cAMP-binding protein